MKREERYSAIRLKGEVLAGKTNGKERNSAVKMKGKERHSTAKCKEGSKVVERTPFQKNSTLG